LQNHKSNLCFFFRGKVAHTFTEYSLGLVPRVGWRWWHETLIEMSLSTTHGVCKSNIETLRLSEHYCQLS